MSSRILLVVSDLEYQTQIVRALRARGIGVDPFNCATAVRNIEPSRVAWSRALIALHLPDDDGTSLGAWLVEHSPKMLLNFLCSSTNAETLSRAQNLGTVLWQPIGMGPLCEQFTRAVRPSGLYMKKSVPPSALKPSGTLSLTGTDEHAMSDINDVDLTKGTPSR